MSITVQIEYCRNCNLHSWCSRHDEAKYKRYFDELSNKIAEEAKEVKIQLKNVPSNYLLRNGPINDGAMYFDTKTGEPVHFPRLGSFEVFMQGSCIFSKLKTKMWPNLDKIISKIKQLKALKQQGQSIAKYDIDYNESSQRVYITNAERYNIQNIFRVKKHNGKNNNNTHQSARESSREDYHGRSLQIQKRNIQLNPQVYVEQFYQGKQIKQATADKETKKWLQKWNLHDKPKQQKYGKKNVYLQQIYPRDAIKKRQLQNKRQSNQQQSQNPKFRKSLQIISRTDHHSGSRSPTRHHNRRKLLPIDQCIKIKAKINQKDDLIQQQNYQDLYQAHVTTQDKEAMMQSKIISNNSKHAKNLSNLSNISKKSQKQIQNQHKINNQKHKLQTSQKKIQQKQEDKNVKNHQEKEGNKHNQHKQKQKIAQTKQKSHQNNQHISQIKQIQHKNTQHKNQIKQVINKDGQNKKQQLLNKNNQIINESNISVQQKQQEKYQQLKEDKLNQQKQDEKYINQMQNQIQQNMQKSEHKQEIIQQQKIQHIKHGQQQQNNEEISLQKENQNQRKDKQVSEQNRSEQLQEIKNQQKQQKQQQNLGKTDPKQKISKEQQKKNQIIIKNQNEITKIKQNIIQLKYPQFAAGIFKKILAKCKQTNWDACYIKNQYTLRNNEEQSEKQSEHTIEWNTQYKHQQFKLNRKVERIIT